MGQIFFGTDSANLQFFTHHCIGSIWHLSVSPASPTAAPGEHFLAAEALGNLQVLYLYLYFVFVFGQSPGFGFVFVFGQTPGLVFVFLFVFGQTPCFVFVFVFGICIWEGTF